MNSGIAVEIGANNGTAAVSRNPRADVPNAPFVKKYFWYRQTITN